MRVEIVTSDPCPCCGEMDCHCKMKKVGQIVGNGKNHPGTICTYHWKEIYVGPRIPQQT